MSKRVTRLLSSIRRELGPLREQRSDVGAALEELEELTTQAYGKALDLQKLLDKHRGGMQSASLRKGVVPILAKLREAVRLLKPIWHAFELPD